MNQFEIADTIAYLINNFHLLYIFRELHGFWSLLVEYIVPEILNFIRIILKIA